MLKVITVGQMLFVKEAKIWKYINIYKRKLFISSGPDWGNTSIKEKSEASASSEDE